MAARDDARPTARERGSARANRPQGSECLPEPVGLLHERGELVEAPGLPSASAARPSSRAALSLSWWVAPARGRGAGRVEPVPGERVAAAPAQVGRIVADVAAAKHPVAIEIDLPGVAERINLGGDSNRIVPPDPGAVPPGAPSAPANPRRPEARTHRGSRRAQPQRPACGGCVRRRLALGCYGPVRVRGYRIGVAIGSGFRPAFLGMRSASISCAARARHAIETAGFIPQSHAGVRRARLYKNACLSPSWPV
jgi:hypothetical protein